MQVCTSALELEMLDPIERTAPGQIACLYEGDVIVGYGTIALTALHLTTARPSFDGCESWRLTTAARAVAVR